MASIKGVQLKALVLGIGHDRLGWQANVYLNNKKIGTVLDDGYGAGLDVYIEKGKREEFLNICNKFKEIKNELIDPEENFFYALKNLTLDEKEYKKAIKRGYKATLLLDFYPRDKNGDIDFSKPIPYPTEKIVYLPKEEMAKQVIEDEKPSKHVLYKTFEDFNIA